MTTRRLLLVFLFCPLTLWAQAGQWVRETIERPVPNLWGVAMFNDDEGLAAGGMSISPNPGGISGVLKKNLGDPVWRVVDTANFTPSLATLGGVTFWSAICVVPGTSTAFICGDRAQVYKSTDGGNTWVQRTSGIVGTLSFFDIRFKNVNEGVVVGNNGTAYYTSNGGTSWVLANTGTANGLYGVFEGGASDWFVVGNTMTAVRWTAPAGPANAIAMPAISGSPRLEGIHFPSSSVGFVVGGNGGVERTLNGGGVWALLPVVTPSPPTLNSVFAFDDQTLWTAGDANALYYTSNAGTNWYKHASVGGASGAVTRIQFPVNQNTGYASGPATSSAQGWILKWQPSATPDISTTSTTLDFGTVECGLSTTMDIDIINSGTGDLVIGAGQVTFTSPEFTLVSPTLPQTIPASGSVPFRVRWTPALGFSGSIPAGTRMIIASNDAAHNPWQITITGVRNRSGITLPVSSLVFPDTCVGAPVTKGLTVNPSGNQPPTLIDVQFVSGHNDVSLLSPTTGTVLSGSTVLQLQCIPGARGNRAGTYRIIAGNPTCPDTLLFTYTGKGLKTHMTPTPSTVDFGDVCVGASKKLTLDLLNDGDTPVTVTGIEFIDGTDVFPPIQGVPFGPFAVGRTVTLNIQFSPQAEGSVQGRYRLVLAPCADTVVLTFRGRGVTASLTANPNPIVISGIGVGSQGSAAVTVTNTGTVPVNVTSIKLSPAAAGLTLQGLPSLPQPLNPGQPISFSVRYAPLKIETIVTQVCVQINQPCVDSVCIPVTVSSEPSPTIVAPGSLALGLQACRDSVVKSFFVKNTGDGALVISRYEITGTDAAHFSVIAPAAPVTVLPKDSVEVFVAFNRTTTGSSSATLTLIHNDSKAGGRTPITLTGQRTVTAIIVEDSDSTRGFVTCVKTGFAKTYRIRNVGTTTAIITAVTTLTPGSPFTIGYILPDTLAPGATHTFQVNFSPGAAGSFTDQIRVQAMPCSLDVVFPVKGRTVSTELRVVPNPIDFGAVTLGDSLTQGVTIENLGTTPVTVIGLLLSPSGPALHFASSPTLPLSIAAGGTRPLNLVFRPTVAGPLSGTLCVVTSDPCPDTICVPVVGMGTSLGLSLNRSQLRFTIDPCAPEVICDTVLVVNNGNAPVTITNVTLEQLTLNLFTISPALNPPVTIPAKSSRPVRICVDPNFSGTFTGKLILLTDDPATPRLELPLSAQRDLVDIRVLDDTLDFGAVTKCASVLEVEVGIRNSGTLPDIVDVRTAPGSPFSIVTPLPLSVDVNQTQRIRVRFAPGTAGTFADSILFVTNRCKQVLRLDLRGQRSDRNYAVADDTLRFGPIPVGSSQNRTTSVENLTLDSLRILRSAFGGSGQFQLLTPLPLVLRKGFLGSLDIRFAPTRKGAVQDTLFLILDEPCADTLRVILLGDALDGGLEFRPTGLQFPPLAQCESRILLDTLVNTSSAAITLVGSTITGPDAALFTILNPVNRIDLAGSGSPYVFQIRCAPGAGPDGPLTATLSVTTTDPSQPVVEAPLSGERRMQRTPVDQSVDFGTLTRGVPASRTVTLTNAGTIPVLYDQATLPSGITIMPSVPFTVAAGGSQTVTLTWTPVSAGAGQGVIVLRTTAPCADSTRITATAQVVDGPWIGSGSFGDLGPCETRTITIRVHNAQAQSASLEILRTSGADSAAFSITAPTGLPRTIAANDSLDVTVQFTPPSLNAASYATSVVATLLVNGVPLTIQGALTARVTPVTVTLSGAPPAFGDVLVGSSATASMTMTNGSPYPVRIASITFTHPDLSLVSTVPALPATLGPGQPLVVTVRLSPAQARTYADSVIVGADLPCAARMAVAVTGRGIEQTVVTARLSVPVLSGQVDQTIDIPVRLDGDVGSASVTAWEGALRFNRTMLYPVAVRSEGTLSRGLTVTKTYDHLTGTLRLQASGSTALAAGSGNLVVVEALVLLGDAIQTPIVVDTSFRFISGTARVASRQDGSFTLDGYCADNGSRLVKTDGNFALRQNHPNPFNPSTVIEYQIGFETHVDLRVYDAMGREVAVLVNGIQSAGTHRLVFEAGGLPSGAYLYRMRSACHSEDRIMFLSK